MTFEPGDEVILKRDKHLGGVVVKKGAKGEVTETVPLLDACKVKFENAPVADPVLVPNQDLEPA